MIMSTLGVLAKNLFLSYAGSIRLCFLHLSLFWAPFSSPPFHLLSSHLHSSSSGLIIVFRHPVVKPLCASLLHVCSSSVERLSLCSGVTDFLNDVVNHSIRNQKLTFHDY